MSKSRTQWLPIIKWNQLEEEIQEQKDQSPFEKDKQIQNFPTPLEGVNDQISESFRALNLNDGHKDEFLDLSWEIEPKKLQKLHLVREKVETIERIKKRTGKCDQQNQEIKNEDLLEHEFGKKNLEREMLYDVEKVFDKKLKMKLIDGVFFLWSGRWSFDPDEKSFFLGSGCWIFDPGKNSFYLEDRNRS